MLAKRTKRMSSDETELAKERKERLKNPPSLTICSLTTYFPSHLVPLTFQTKHFNLLSNGSITTIRWLIYLDSKRRRWFHSAWQPSLGFYFKIPSPLRYHPFFYRDSIITNRWSFKSRQHRPMISSSLFRKTSRVSFLKRNCNFKKLFEI